MSWPAGCRIVSGVALVALVAACGGSSPSASRDAAPLDAPEIKTALNAIQSSQIKQHMSVLADDRLEGRGLVFSSAKPPEQGDGLVLRCWNARAEPGSGGWRFSRPVTRAVRLRADERSGRGEEIAPAESGRVVPLAVEPHGIATVRVEFAG